MMSAGPRCTQTSASMSTSMRGERLEHGGWPNREMTQPNPGRRENGVADGRRDHGRARLAEADWHLDAVDELDVELRHVADAQRRIAVEVRVLHLAFGELGAFMERHAEAPERAAFDLRERAGGMNERGGSDHDGAICDPQRDGE